jgi:predicted PurR-regulated permease PerM
VLAQVWQPLLLALWFAVLVTPLLDRLEHHWRGRRPWAAALTVVLFLLIAAPAIGLTAAMVTSAVDFVQGVAKGKGARQILEGIVSQSTGTPRHLGQMGLQDVLSLTQRYGGRALTVLGALAGATAEVFVALFVFVAAAYSFLAHGRSAWGWFADNLPLERRHLDRFAAAFAETGRGLILGTGGTAVIQGATATIAYFALGIPRALLLGMLTTIAALVPSVGTALVTVPVMVGLVLTGSWVRAVILLAVSLLFVGLLDNLLRPVLSRYGRLRLPTFVVLIAMFGGIAVFGPWGLLLGPLLVRLGVEAVSIAHDEGMHGGVEASSTPGAW